MLLVLFSIIALVITTRLWKWYDSLLSLFSHSIRVLDIITWGLILWFIIYQYQKKVSLPQRETWSSLSQYFNFYTWVSLTIIGFMIIGFLRLFIKNNLFHK